MIMKNMLLSRSLLFGIMMIVIVGCKKSVDIDSQTASLKGINWLFTQENLYFPNSEHDVILRSSTWTFSDDHKFKMLSTVNFISEERGVWSAQTGKISISIRNDEVF